MEIAAKIAVEFWVALLQMSPYLLLGFAVAGIMSVMIPAEKVEKHLGGRGIWPVLKAALFGVPLPLCSCGVIPVAVSLRKHGASTGATTSFLISTPQTGVDSILVTYALLGPVFAVFRPIMAFVTGIAGGLLTDAFDRRNLQLPEEPERKCTGECCSTGPKSNIVVRAMRYGFLTLPKEIAKPMLFGLFVAGVIAVLVPDDYFAGILGGGIVAMLVMMLVGMPMYVCATASVPIAAALIQSGVSPGAALVFLISGPATNVAAIATLWKTMGGKATSIYLGTIAVGALLAGLLLDWLFVVSGVKPNQIVCHSEPSLFAIVSAMALLVMLTFGLRKQTAGGKDTHTHE